MRRSTIPRSVVVLALALVGLVGLGRAGAQEGATPVVDQPGAHPVVGAWLADTDAEDPENAPSLVVVHADGTYVEADVDGVGVGAWEATGEQTAILTIVFVEPPEEATEGAEGEEAEEAEDGEEGEEGAGGGRAIVRAEVEVAADGQSFVASYTLEFVEADGASTGQFGPGTATGTRIVAEAPGEPVGTFEDLFGQFEEDEEDEEG